MCLVLLCNQWALADADTRRTTSSHITSKDTDAHNADRAEMIARLGPEVTTRNSDHYTVFFAPGVATSNEAEAHTVALLERTLLNFYQVMQASGFRLQTMSGPLPWIAFANSGQFNRYAIETDRMNLSWLDGYYSARTNRVVMMRLTPERTAHEAAHQLAFNSGLQTRGVMYPLWVSEGLATSFETACVQTAGPGMDNAGRRMRLLEARDNHRLRPLAEFLTMTRVPAGDTEVSEDLYAQCWGVFQFIFKHHRRELRAYLVTLARLPAGPRNVDRLSAELTRGFGDMPKLTRQWETFLSELGPAAPSRIVVTAAN